jgi:uncharacterized protein YjhX (UPF0386 family)
MMKCLGRLDHLYEKIEVSFFKKLTEKIY